MEDSPFPTPSIDKPSSKRRKRLIFLIFAIIIILVAAYLGSRFLGGSEEGTSDITPEPTEFVIPTDIPAPTEEVTLTPEPTEKPTPTPTVKVSQSTSSVDKTTGLDRADLKVAVQNGSGEKGVASKTSGELKGFGYDVVSSGNADNFDYSDVTIQVKSIKKDYLAILKKDLSPTYTIGSATSDLDSSSSFDAVVIVGK